MTTGWCPDCWRTGGNKLQERFLLLQPNLVISLPYGRNKNRDNIVERIQPQPRLLQVLRDLPVCTGVGVRRDVVEIKDFYTLVSGEAGELNGFLDLSVMAVAAGFKLRARNMTALGVKVVGAVLK